MKQLYIVFNSMFKEAFNMLRLSNNRPLPYPPTRENVCCKYMKKYDFIYDQQSGIIRLNFNYCPTCGRRLQR